VAPFRGKSRPRITEGIPRIILGIPKIIRGIPRKKKRRPQLISGILRKESGLPGMKPGREERTDEKKRVQAAHAAVPAIDKQLFID
jgi:hypothetical protein